MKKRLAMILAGLMVMSMAVPTAAATGDEEFTIALCAKTEGIAWFDDMRTGVDEFSADHDDVYAYEINPEGSDAAKQNAMLEQWRLSGFAMQVLEILGLELELHLKGGM